MVRMPISSMRRVRKGQVAMEYLIIFSVAFFMTLPLIIIFANQTQNLQSDIANAQIDKAATLILDAAEEVYFMGQPAQKTIRVTFPSRVQSATVLNRALLFNVTGNDFTYEYFKETNINLSGSLQSFEGPHVIVVKAQANNVLITDT